MGPDRLPRMCMERQVKLLTSDSNRKTWLQRVRDMLRSANVCPDFANWHSVDWLALRGRVTEHVERSAFESSFARAMASEYCPMYRYLTRRHRFIADESINSLRLILQIQLTNDHVPRLIWDGILIRFSPGSRCPLCNTGAFDTPAHFILDCPVLAGYRPTTVAALARCPATENLRLASVLNDRSALSVLGLFVATAIRVRNLPDHV